MRALLAGEIDVTSAVGQQRVGRLHGRADVVLDSQIGLNLAFLSINNERPPSATARVRQALARAIDRAALVARPARRPRRAGAQPAAAQLWGYTTRTRELFLDRAAARRLLAEAGFPGGFDTTLLVTVTPRPYLPAPRRLAEQLRDDLAQVGVRAVLQDAATWSDYVGRATRGRLRPRRARLAGGHHRPQRLPLRPARLRVDRLHEPQPLPEPGHGRAAQAGPPRAAIQASARAPTARPRRSSRRTCPGCRSTTCPSSPRTGGSSRASPSAPQASLRFDKAWKTR